MNMRIQAIQAYACFLLPKTKQTLQLHRPLKLSHLTRQYFSKQQVVGVKVFFTLHTESMEQKKEMYNQPKQRKSQRENLHYYPQVEEKDQTFLRELSEKGLVTEGEVLGSRKLTGAQGQEPGAGVLGPSGPQPGELREPEEQRLSASKQTQDLYLGDKEKIQNLPVNRENIFNPFLFLYFFMARS